MCLTHSITPLFSYSPLSHTQELAISAGDYLYAFGDMDADGFYFSQLVSGETGLVPSNFVEKVAEGEESEWGKKHWEAVEMEHMCALEYYV